MASSPLWPFDDNDRPSGSVQPLSQADLQAILAHLGDDPDQLLAGPAPAKHAPPTPSRARARTGRRRGQPGPNPLPRRRLTAGTPPRGGFTTVRVCGRRSTRSWSSFL